MEQEYMRIAIQEASKAPWPFGAVVVRDGNILAQAGAGDGEDNLIDPTAHAETNAIRMACKSMRSSQLEGAVLYASCEPCALCMGAAWYAGIRRIVYGSSIEEEEGIFKWKDFAVPRSVFSEMGDRRLVVEGGLLQEEVLEMYRQHSLYPEG